MYVHGIVRNGVRGVHLDYEDVVQGDENREEYGIDWEDMDRPTIRNHHDTFNPSLPAENLNGVNRRDTAHIVRKLMFVLVYLVYKSRDVLY